jgi:hypothetical protein
LSPVIETFERSPNITLIVSVSTQPFESVPVTLYTVGAAGLTEMLEVVWPVLHKYVIAPEAVKVSGFPEQKTVAPLMVTVGLGLTITVLLAMPVHPLLSVIVTE